MIACMTDRLRFRAKSPAQFCAVMLLAISATGSSLAAQETARDTTAAAIITDFLYTWRTAWMESELSRNKLIDIPSLTAVQRKDKYGNLILVTPDSYPVSRLTELHQFDGTRPQNRIANTFCTIRTPAQDFWKLSLLRPNPERLERVQGAGLQIISQNAPIALCPTWYLGPDSAPPWDERLGIDRALLPDKRTKVRTARAELIQSLKTRRHADPADNFLVGQQVRFLIDQQDTAGAVSTVESCGATPFWCSLLAGYVENWRGNLHTAKLRYDEALRLMDQPLRCELNNIALLLEWELRARYSALPCQQQDSANQIIWWLARPLWTSDLNPRLLEHYSRQVRLFILRSLPEDERFHWADHRGGDARAEIVIRYGWPGLMFWRGFSWDSLAVSHQHPDAPRMAPNVTYEYGRGRMHLLPTQAAIMNPFGAPPEAWTINSPPGGDTVIHWNPPFPMDNMTTLTETRVNQLSSWKYFRELHPIYARETLWWPEEHYKSNSQLMQFAQPVTVMYPRDDHALFASALLLRSTDVKLANGTSIANASFILSPSPDSFNIATLEDAKVGTATVVQRKLPFTPQMVGVEYGLGDMALRTRFGITPPASLTSIKPGDVTVSRIALVRAPSAGREMPHSTVAILDSLLPSPEIKTGNRFAIYWETYGIAQREPATYKVTMQRITERTGWQRFVGAIRRAADPNAPKP